MGAMFLLKFAKMSNRLAYFINTRLQPGVESGTKDEPFQRLVCSGKPLKRFLSFRRLHRAEARC
jgi:hypothetical protein